MSSQEIPQEEERTGMSPATLERAMLDHLYYSCAKNESSATALDLYKALALTVRDRLVQRWMATQRTYYEQDTKRVYYLSAEYLLGRMLRRNLSYLGILDTARELLSKHDINLDHLMEQETDPGLGNGGLGRLAACFMDSMAALELPGYGYGIRYEFGIFHQVIKDGWQIEQGDAWLRYGSPWEIVRHEYTTEVNFYGRVEHTTDAQGKHKARWVNTETLLGVPYDTLCPGYRNNTVNTLRLWSARASRDFNLEVFNDGDYRRAVEEKADGESISKVLYPKDDTYEGKELRLKQQYFFVCCSLQDILRRYKKHRSDFTDFPHKVALQLNDTHPAITIAECMRLFVDQEGLTWEEAWSITQRSTGFTNHTLLSEALEKWPVALFSKLLPRHMEIIYEINARFLRDVRFHAPSDQDRLRRMSIIEEGQGKQIRMAHLAVVGSHTVNGVAQLHSDLIKSQLLPDFHEMTPDKFQNKTNGVTPRRWLLLCNPHLANLITDALGTEAWITDLDRLQGLSPLAEDSAFLERLGAIKRQNKVRLAQTIAQTTGIKVDPHSLFDVQIKRIHQYKRQLMNCMHIISLYQQLKHNPSMEFASRVFIFGGKAAPGYAMAKLHIKLINDVANVVNHDPEIKGRLKVVFLPNYNVSQAEIIIPGTDISEQISMAGKEASGTGNMKFAMNGALTLGTLDGANIEIRDCVGEDNFFLFGLDVDKVKALKARGYVPAEHIAASKLLKDAIDLVDSGFFAMDEPKRFAPIVDSLRQKDPYLIGADFEDYARAHREVDQAWRNPIQWQRHVLHNIAGMGTFSSDRTIRQYAQEIWDVHPCPVALT